MNVIVIGAGAAGLIAGISARRKGAEVVVCERLSGPGKKLLATGGGKCNIWNRQLDPSAFNPAGRKLAASVFEKFGVDDIERFFEGIGVYTYSQSGRVFPVTNQASTVQKALLIEAAGSKVRFEYNFEVSRIIDNGQGFIVEDRKGRRLYADKLLISGGGRSYPALGSNGSCYELAKAFGHAVVDPVPACVPLLVKDKLCHLLQGQKIQAKATAVIDGKAVSEAEGELLFTAYGLSGTAVLDVSREISVACNRRRCTDAEVLLDLVPFLTEEQLSRELKRRVGKNKQPEELLVGLLPNKFCAAFFSLCSAKDAAATAAALKRRSFAVSGTRGWNEAEFTAGGVEITQVKEGTLESLLRKNLYFAGEVLDVDGKRGGYNLAWAWASGFVAGMAG